MPKHKISEMPIIKKGQNGDFFCYMSGKKVYLARNSFEAKKKLILLLSQEIQQNQEAGNRRQNRPKILKEDQYDFTTENIKFSNYSQNEDNFLNFFDDEYAKTQKVVRVDEIILDFLKLVHPTSAYRHLLIPRIFSLKYSSSRKP